jgi:hypothetical protein
MTRWRIMTFYPVKSRLYSEPQRGSLPQVMAAGLGCFGSDGNNPLTCRCGPRNRCRFVGGFQAETQLRRSTFHSASLPPHHPFAADIQECSRRDHGREWITTLCCWQPLDEQVVGDPPCKTQPEQEDNHAEDTSHGCWFMELSGGSSGSTAIQPSRLGQVDCMKKTLPQIENLLFSRITRQRPNS